MDDCVRCNPIVKNSTLCETCQQILTNRILVALDEELAETEGYDSKFFVDLSKHYECPLCLGALRDPVQIAGECGHVFCEKCLNRANQRGPKKCPLDREPFIQTFPDRSKRREVLSLRVTCQNSGCSWKGELLDLLNHLGRNCQKVRINCLNDRCREKILREKIVEHCLECNFPPIIPCTFVEFGCTFEGSRSQIDKHIKNALNEHFSLTTAKINQQENKIKQQENRINELETKINVLQENNNDLKIQNAEIVKNNQDLKKQLQGKFDILQSDFDNKDDIFSWKISNYQTQFRNAQNKNPEHIYSPALYTSHGYKFQLRAFLNGRGSGENTHTSVYFKLCKGVNDDALEWPFNKKYTLTIVSQNDRVDDKTHTIDPAQQGEDAKKCFMKPTTDMNRGWGWGFLSHTEKQHYIKDDTMVIKCVVEC